MPPVGFEPAIPASDRPQTLALDGSDTGIGRDSNPGPSSSYPVAIPIALRLFVRTVDGDNTALCSCSSLSVYYCVSVCCGSLHDVTIYKTVNCWIIQSFRMSVWAEYKYRYLNTVGFDAVVVGWVFHDVSNDHGCFMIRVRRFFKRRKLTRPTTRRHVPEDGDLQRHNC